MSRLQQLAAHPALKGIAIGHCAEQDEWNETRDRAGYREAAHSHIRGKYRGWVCIRRVSDYTVTTVRHELAHIVRGDAIHNEAWRRVVRELGGRVERMYRKR